MTRRPPKQARVATQYDALMLQAEWEDDGYIVAISELQATNEWWVQATDERYTCEL